MTRNSPNDSPGAFTHGLCLPLKELQNVSPKTIFGGPMRDLIFLLSTLAFFILAIAYVHFCERVK
jgi:hypothetical protein